MMNIFIAAALVSCFSYIKTGQSGTNCLKKDKNGTCFCCKSGFRDPNCNIPCMNCTSRIAEEKCVYMCKSGSYGKTCSKKCPITCATSETGFHLCDENNGEPDCNGCISGYYGDQCNKSCPSNCHNRTCFQIDGTCNKCNNSQFHGDYCNESCSTGCSSGICSKSGCCIDGCKDGFYGESCIHLCGSNCLQKRCKSDTYSTFICTNGCKDGYMGANCSDKCPTNCEKCDRRSGRCTSCVDDSVQVDQSGKCTTAEVDWVAPAVASTITTVIFITIIFILIIMCKKKRKKHSGFCIGQMIKKSGYSPSSQSEDEQKQMCFLKHAKQFDDGHLNESDEPKQYCIITKNVSPRLTR